MNNIEYKIIKRFKLNSDILYRNIKEKVPEYELFTALTPGVRVRNFFTFYSIFSGWQPISSFNIDTRLLINIIDHQLNQFI